ncbi:MAG: ATP synthase F0 subunit B [Deltaproteobacteria bacterium]|nr:ATP synthase F0 subunit B [Deltaproteobacteria bacterium]
MNLEISRDIVIIQLGVFLTLLAVLNYFVFNPILKILHERNQKGKETFQKAQELSDKTEALAADYEHKKEGYIRQRSEKVEQVKQGLAIHQKEQVEKTRKNLLGQLNQAQREMNQKIQGIQSNLKSETRNLVELVAKKFLAT